MSRLDTAAGSIALTLIVLATFSDAALAFKPGIYDSEETSKAIFSEAKKADIQLECNNTDDIHFKRGPATPDQTFTRAQVADLLKKEKHKVLMVATLSRLFPGRYAPQKMELRQFKDFLADQGYSRTLILGQSGYGVDVITDSAEPIDPLSLEAAYLSSEWIGNCEFDKYETNGKVSLFNPPIAICNRWECLKGPPFAQTLHIIWEFDQGNSPEKRMAWTFSPEMMPQKGSHWLIFLPNAVPIPGRGFETYGGSYGHMEATEANLNALKKLFEKYRGRE